MENQRKTELWIKSYEEFEFELSGFCKNILEFTNPTENIHIQIDLNDEYILPDWICEECYEPIKRYGNELKCENGCYEDDIRNNYPEDYLEEFGIPNIEYPKDMYKNE